MKRKYRLVIYLLVLIIIITGTFSATWMFLTRVTGDRNIYKYGDTLKNEIYKYNNRTYYYGPKDESSKQIDYDNAIIEKNNTTGSYKLVVSLNDEENTLLKTNSLFYKNHFYIISRDIVAVDLNKRNKKVYKENFIGNSNVSHIYGVKKGWIYIKVTLFKENDSKTWYENKYYKIETETCELKEIPQKLLPEFE